MGEKMARASFKVSAGPRGDVVSHVEASRRSDQGPSLQRERTRSATCTPVVPCHPLAHGRRSREVVRPALARPRWLRLFSAGSSVPETLISSLIERPAQVAEGSSEPFSPRPARRLPNGRQNRLVSGRQHCRT